MTMRSGRRRDDDPANAGGWKAIVAIADVSFYVRPGSALDKEARKRGNSVYFPDRVVPMLPETLSAEICSLKEGEDRAALACHLQVAKDGQLKSWRFTRARVRIAANIAYEDAQAAIDAAEGRRSAVRSEEEPIELASSPCSFSEADMNQTAPPVPPELVERTLKPLWACWRALYAARAKRGPLELDLPERRVVLDEKGRIMSVAPRERLDAHKLIEDYMIAANVAAAKALEAKKEPVMYRVHEPPSREKLVALKDYLKTFEHRVRARPGGPPGDVQPHPRADRRGGLQAADHGAGAAHPDPGLLRPAESRPFRAGARHLRPFHLADPPLCRPARPPRAGARLRARPGRRADRPDRRRRPSRWR